jgi:hypothetical protein
VSRNRGLSFSEIKSTRKPGNTVHILYRIAPPPWRSYVKYLKTAILILTLPLRISNCSNFKLFKGGKDLAMLGLAMDTLADLWHRLQAKTPNPTLPTSCNPGTSRAVILESRPLSKFKYYLGNLKSANFRGFIW